jgi:outer membrane protein OmpA-like peptidoglycan-associated protein
MKNIILFILLIIGIGFNAVAGDKSHKELRGDKHFFVYSFAKAIDSYSRVKQLTAEGQRRLAESYRNVELPALSEMAYEKLLRSPEGVLPEDYYSYAMLLKINGKHAESNKAMDAFVELKPYDLRSVDYNNNKTKFTALLKDDGSYKINTMKINTNAEDFAPAYYMDKIVFASSRARPKMIVRNNNWTGNPFYNLYISEVDNGQLTKPVIFNKGFNGKMHDGPASFTKDGNFMAFTHNNYNLKRKDKIVELEIHFCRYENGKWSKTEPFYLNNVNFSVGHPCLTADGNTMYFISDTPGGFGGADIYKVHRDENGTWGNAINLGDKINTEGDEMFPFFEENSNTLFFSSNGRFGLGGLDVFIAEYNGSEVGAVYNAGAPLNTRFDDYGVIVDKEMAKGYFSSNRSGGSGSDDIYSFEFIKAKEAEKTLSGIAKDNNNNHLSATFIALLDDNNNVLDTFTTKEDGAYSFTVETGKKFMLTGQKVKYSDGKNTANTLGEELNVKADLILLVQEVIAEKKDGQKPKKGDDLGKMLNFNPKTIYFDYGKYEIREDAKKDLDMIIKVMNENPKMVIELASHTDCISSKGFNQTLSNNRAKASADYIKKGITNPGRISGKGYGETKLISQCPCEGEVVSNCSDNEHQKNRRTEFMVIKD